MHFDSLHFMSLTSSVYSLRFFIWWLRIALTPPKTRIIDKFKRSVSADVSDSKRSFFRFQTHKSHRLFHLCGRSYKIIAKTILSIDDFIINAHKKLSIVINDGWIRGKACFITFSVIWEDDQMCSTVSFVFASIVINKNPSHWYFNITATICLSMTLRESMNGGIRNASFRRRIKHPWIPCFWDILHRQSNWYKMPCNLRIEKFAY